MPIPIQPLKLLKLRDGPPSCQDCALFSIRSSEVMDGSGRLLGRSGLCDSSRTAPNRCAEPRREWGSLVVIRALPPADPYTPIAHMSPGMFEMAEMLAFWAQELRHRESEETFS